MLLSENSENELGAKAWDEIKKKERQAKDPEYLRALTRVGLNISKVVDRPDFKWEFLVFDSKVPNAFCLPGGKVAVYNSLFKYAANDAELASVVGHEVAHAVARHGGERISHQIIQQSVAQLLPVAISDIQLAQTVLGVYGAASNVGAILPFSRKHEYEADKLGLFFMAKAGYDPAAAVSFWKKFGELSKINAFEQLFSTHPAGDNRVKELSRFLPEAMKYYDNAEKKLGLGVKYDKAMMNPEFFIPKDKDFYKKAFGYKLKYPGDWQAKVANNILTLNPVEASCVVYIQNVPYRSEAGSYQSIDTLARELQDKLRRKASRCRIYGKKVLNIKGYRALEFSSEFRLKRVDILQKSLIIGRKDRQLMYVVSFIAPSEKYEEFLPQAGKVFKSFSIVDDK